LSVFQIFVRFARRKNFVFCLKGYFLNKKT
jgi:hypothetical protein